MFIEIDLEKIKNRLLRNRLSIGNRSDEMLESLLSRFDWRTFESTVAEIFAANGFFVRKNLRFKTDRRYEIDIIASNSRDVFCIDCKDWSGGRYKRSGLRIAAEAQILRTKELENFVSGNSIARHKLRINPNSVFYPTIVTLFEEDVSDIVDVEGVHIIPVWKLNSFLNSF